MQWSNRSTLLVCIQCFRWALDLRMIPWPWQILYFPQQHDVLQSKVLRLSLESLCSIWKKIFLCIAAKNFRPRCRRFTSEENGFNKGWAILEIGDGGNNLRMFGQKPVYAFAVQDCPQLTEACLPCWWETSITCLLPRKFCVPWSPGCMHQWHIIECSKIPHC